MARGKSSPGRRCLREVLGRRAVEAAARRHGVVQRQRKVDTYVLVWTLVLGFQVGAKRTLEGLRQLYQRSSGQSLGRASFYGRLSTPMATMLRRLALDALAAQPDGPKMPAGPLSTFTELLAFDATVLRLHRLLQRAFSGTRTHQVPAAAKFHVVLNVLDGSPRRVKLTSERTGDTAPWRRLGTWVQDRLLLFDLGFYSFWLFHRIDNNGGFFVTRAKTTFNPTIVAVHRRWRGRSIDVVGQRLREVLPRLQRAFLDVEVQVRFKKRVYNGVRATHRRTFRLVAVRNDETGLYHCYLTNVAASVLPAEDLRATYALRWQVELLFKSLRSHGHLGHLPSSKRAVVECLVWASVLAVIVSSALYREVRCAVARDRFMPLLRWAALFARLARDLLAVVLSKPRPDHQGLFDQLVREAPDPNRNRKNRAFQHVPVSLAA